VTDTEVDNAAALRARIANANESEARAGGRLERGDHVELGQRIVDLLGGDVVFSEGMLWRYQGPHWQTVEPGRAERLAQGFAGQLVGIQRPSRMKMKSSDVTGSVREAQRSVHDATFFADAPRGAQFRDRFVAISEQGTIAVQPASKERRARWALPFNYRPETPPARLLEALRDMFLGPQTAVAPEGERARAEEDCALKIQLLQEFYGACFVGAPTRYQRYLILLGDGANGKSTLTDLLASVFPPNSVSAIPIQELGREYSRALLAGKLLNSVSELPERDILESESIKAVVVGDPITARRIRQDPFTMTPVAGHVFAPQRLPAVVDFSHGFWRRPMIIRFDVTFAEHPTPLQRKKNEKLLEELRGERDAIAAWLIAGAAAVAKRGRYHEPPSSVEAVENWRHSTDQLHKFCAWYFQEHDFDGVDQKVVYRTYRDWCDGTGHKPFALDKVWPRLEQYRRGLGDRPKVAKAGF
jgi:P4 family phage/plasmid primase-like protien